MTASAHDPFFYIEDSQVEGRALRLGASDSHHLIKVRRARQGELVNVSDGRGTVFSVRLVVLDRDLIEGEIVDEQFIEPPKPSVGILQALAKGSKVDSVVQKLVEVGVDRIAIFAAGRSIPIWSEEKKARALQRWSNIGREAAKQSRRAWLPEVIGPLGLEDAIKLMAEYELKLMGHAGGDQLSKTLGKASPQSVIGVIGPEGGLTESEIERLAEHASPVGLGDNILRTETAALVLASSVMYHFGRI